MQMVGEQQLPLQPALQYGTKNARIPHCSTNLSLRIEDCAIIGAIKVQEIGFI